MKNKGLTLTIVFQAESANYGESIGNVASLKKMAREGEIYLYYPGRHFGYNIANNWGSFSSVKRRAAARKDMQFARATIDNIRK